jgi:hypothetical protein
MSKCWHIFTIDIPDWEIVDRYPTYNPKKQYVKCVKCHKIIEVKE